MKRFLSLDILRGFTVACMIMVNNPGKLGAYVSSAETLHMGRLFSYGFGVPHVFIHSRRVGMVRDAENGA